MTSENLIDWTQKLEDANILGTRGRVNGIIRYYIFSAVLGRYPRGPLARLIYVRNRISSIESFGLRSEAIEMLKDHNASKLFIEARYSPERIALHKGTITLSITDSIYQNSDVSDSTIVGQLAELVSELNRLRERRQSWANHDCSECGEWWS